MEGTNEALHCENAEGTVMRLDPEKDVELLLIDGAAVKSTFISSVTEKKYEKLLHMLYGFLTTCSQKVTGALM